MADSWDNLLLIAVAVFGSVAIVFNVVHEWHSLTRLTKAIHIYKCAALLFNVLLHVRQIQHLKTDNALFMVAAIMLVSSITMRAIVDGGKGRLG